MIDLPVMRRPRTTPTKVYIRFGRWSTRSTNYSTFEDEIGVSVYPAVMQDGIVSLDAQDYDVPVKCIQGRLAFPVTGSEVGRGSDGEPVLRGVKALAYAIDWLSMPVGINEHWS